MALQKVFRLPQRTSIHDLVVNDEPIPVPSPNEVLIKIRKVSLNYRDVAVATSKYPFTVKGNVVPCSDFAGDVVSVGNRVEGFAPHDRVISSFDLNTPYGAIQDWNHSLGGNVDGALRQYIALPSDALVKIPEDSQLDYAQASTLVCTGATAWNALYGNVALKPGQTVLFLEQYGVDYTINYNQTPDWSSEVLKITKGRGADFILENGGAGTIAKSIDAVAYGGNISVIGFLAACAQDEMPDVAALALSKGAVVRGIMVGSKQQLEDVTRFVVAKGLKLPVEKEFGFSRDEVIAACEYMMGGQHIGKICISVA
ncbi:chaperonin 10-like protein [Ilyonectria robusta]|uniref:chaperonin 10-like protein n=1 Tax=Ilyonectria robusta TaxID=1079257 RepID=UPI001E8D18B7|nr:chaperonin 10-like protein [Ilyonectria robusta]KAH8664772.1 chaperonin 10-like protein [Ilyonectria robusta]